MYHKINYSQSLFFAGEKRKVKAEKRRMSQPDHSSSVETVQTHQGVLTVDTDQEST